jgi:hypothetical protein
MHLKIFEKLEKKPKNPLVWEKNPKKPKKTQKNPLGWFFFLKTRVFSNPEPGPGRTLKSQKVNFYMKNILVGCKL